VDLQVLLFTLGVAFLTGLAFGLAPALEGTRFELNSMLKDSAARGTGSMSGGRFRKILVAGETAMAVLVVVCGALLVNSFIRMMRVDPGFQGDRVLVAQMQLPPKYSTKASISQFYDRVLERLAAMPGVDRAAAAQFTPFSGGGNLQNVLAEGRPEPPAGQLHMARVNSVTPGYLEAMSIPLMAGRTISRQDSADAPLAIVIGETLMKREFGAGNPVGRRIRLNRKNPMWYTVVGVVKDVKYYQLSEPPENQAYLAFAQAPSGSMDVIARMSGDPSAVAQSIRTVVRSVDPNQPVSSLLTIAAQIEARNAPQKILSQVTGFFGTLALFLAAIGIYGVMAYSVSQRTQEIGVRMALGAQSRDVLTLIVRQGMGMVIGGIVAGLIGALAMARVLANWLYGIQPSDPATFITTIATLTAVALLACWIPARRAAKVDPLVALRYE
jgi:putative ABC transport system permease protein